MNAKNIKFDYLTLMNKVADFFDSLTADEKFFLSSIYPGDCTTTLYPCQTDCESEEVLGYVFDEMVEKGCAKNRPDLEDNFYRTIEYKGYIFQFVSDEKMNEKSNKEECADE